MPALKRGSRLCGPRLKVGGFYPKPTASPMIRHEIAIAR